VARAVRTAPDAAGGARALRDGMPAPWAKLANDAEIEAMRARLAAMELPPRPRLTGDDLFGALGIFIIVVSTTFPVALPFVVMDDPHRALLVSRILTLAMLFVGGLALGRFAGYGSWRAGLAMVGLGIALTVAIIALGG
jgi:VIT1/CCC1 family predicted Fe2+/Mn2+ transporter